MAQGKKDKKSKKEEGPKPFRLQMIGTGKAQFDPTTGLSVDPDKQKKSKPIDIDVAFSSTEEAVVVLSRREIVEKGGEDVAEAVSTILDITASFLGAAADDVKGGKKGGKGKKDSKEGKKKTLAKVVFRTVMRRPDLEHAQAFVMLLRRMQEQGKVTVVLVKKNPNKAARAWRRMTRQQDNRFSSSDVNLRYVSDGKQAKFSANEAVQAMRDASGDWTAALKSLNPVWEQVAEASEGKKGSKDGPKLEKTEPPREKRPVVLGYLPTDANMSASNHLLYYDARNERVLEFKRSKENDRRIELYQPENPDRVFRIIEFANTEETTRFYNTLLEIPEVLRLTIFIPPSLPSQTKKPGKKKKKEAEQPEVIGPQGFQIIVRYKQGLARAFGWPNLNRELTKEGSPSTLDAVHNLENAPTSRVVSLDPYAPKDLASRHPAKVDSVAAVGNNQQGEGGCKGAKQRAAKIQAKNSKPKKKKGKKS